ncbi:hypothetical protein GUJ93_ZPchr0012g20146 [Zizania palustris]|uniref:Uncharacterized protein n=1 Tax=Zizania palustris TaxID=103762 RepID=A0A8J6BSQ9_ZIZPA|nr:hypothetical protein GUJ93_ZPchr0012g20146 [Zizania palustris]KAG8095112.1 hypothetical protein GUJ93_ZPchr0012g20146 [Zizania palustris]
MSTIYSRSPSESSDDDTNTNYLMSNFNDFIAEETSNSLDDHLAKAMELQMEDQIYTLPNIHHRHNGKRRFR